MHDQKSLEYQLRVLSEDLAARESVAPRVMRDVRGRLAASESPPSPKRIRRWIMRPAPRFAAGLISLASFVVVVVVWMRPAAPAATVAFPDVQEAVAPPTK